MKLNIFAINPDELGQLKTKLLASHMDLIKEVDQAGWHGSFYYSRTPIPSNIPWVQTYKSYFKEIEEPKNRNYFSAFIFEKRGAVFALSYGKAHFYLRPFSDYDFGIELAKRIANEGDVKQTASKRFQGKKRKDIKSYANNSRLDVESGESIDYLQGGVIDGHKAAFGKNGKFGTSALLSPDISPGDLGTFLNHLTEIMAEPPRFKLPRTTILTDPAEVAKYDAMLASELLSEIGTTDFTQNSFDLYGVDFVFSSEGTFKIRCRGHEDVQLQELTMGDLKTFIASNHLSAADVLTIRIVSYPEDRPSYAQTIKQAVDYIVDREFILLSGGKWMRFNQDYLEFLEESLRSIRLEDVEPEFSDIYIGEPEFNMSAEITAAGYSVADKDFTIFKTRSSTPVEAWDLVRGDTVYAVKFGTPQKMGYVCDQAVNVLELLRTKSEVKKVPTFKSYCLWLGYRAQKPVIDITTCGSIIFKQKIDAWARKTTELGLEPVLKISRKMKDGVDKPRQVQMAPMPSKEIGKISTEVD